MWSCLEEGFPGRPLTQVLVQVQVLTQQVFRLYSGSPQASGCERGPLGGPHQTQEQRKL